jgi:hypothetical protein
MKRITMTRRIRLVHAEPAASVSSVRAGAIHALDNKSPCPRCKKVGHLVRVEHQPGIDVYRYHCGVCRWQWLDAQRARVRALDARGAPAAALRIVRPRSES